MRLISIVILILLVSCKKEKPEEVLVDEVLSNGVVVLCEGLFQQNNSSISWIDYDQNSVTNNLFSQKAGRPLGDTGNDIQRYGGKIYIVVNVSSTVEVLDGLSFNSIKQIQMMNGGSAKQPRSIAFYGSNAYVTCYDGFVDVIDTVSLSVTNRIAVGLNPEGLVVANNKLFVSNSGGLSAPLMDSTVSVIDLNTNMELQKIIVGMNPGSIITDHQGSVYVISRGDYSGIPSKLVKIDPVNDMVLNQLNIELTSLCRMNNKLLLGYYNYGTSQSSVALFDPITNLVENGSFIDNSGITTLYGVQYDAGNDQVYIMDAMGFTNTGYVRRYNGAGSNTHNYHIGLNPTKILIYD